MRQISNRINAKNKKQKQNSWMMHNIILKLAEMRELSEKEKDAQLIFLRILLIKKKGSRSRLPLS